MCLCAFVCFVEEVESRKVDAWFPGMPSEPRGMFSLAYPQRHSSVIIKSASRHNPVDSTRAEETMPHRSVTVLYNLEVGEV